MALKDWLRSPRSGKEREEREYTPDELMALERYEEAKAMLVERLRYQPKDLNAHLKLADVYHCLQEPESCKQELLYVVGAYAEDGFYDKARAVLTKMNRLFPEQIDVEQKMAALKRAKRLEYDRDKTRRALISHGRLDDAATGRMTVEFEMVWKRLVNTTFVDQISSADLTHFFESARLKRLRPKELVAQRGPVPRALYLIVEGSIEARGVDRQRHEISLRSFGVGDIVGDTVLFDERTWPANYYCDEAALLLELDAEGAKKLVDSHPDPSGLLNVLRGQGNDSTVERAVDHLSR